MATLRDLVVNGTVRATGPIYGDGGFVGNLDWKYVQNKVKASQTADGIMSKEDKLALDKMAILYTKFRNGWTLITQELYNQGITAAKSTSTPAEVKQYIIDLKNKASVLAYYSILDSCKSYEVWNWTKGNSKVSTTFYPNDNKKIYVGSGGYLQSTDFDGWNASGSPTYLAGGNDETSALAQKCFDGGGPYATSGYEGYPILTDPLSGNIFYLTYKVSDRTVRIHLKGPNGESYTKSGSLATGNAPVKDTSYDDPWYYCPAVNATMVQIDSCHYFVNINLETAGMSDGDLCTGAGGMNLRFLTMTSNTSFVITGNVGGSWTAGVPYNQGWHYNSNGDYSSFTAYNDDEVTIDMLYPRTQYKGNFSRWHALLERENYSGSTYKEDGYIYNNDIYKYYYYQKDGTMGATAFSWGTSWGSCLASANDNATFRITCPDKTTDYWSGVASAWKTSKYSLGYSFYNASQNAKEYIVSRFQNFNTIYKISKKLVAADVGAAPYWASADPEYYGDRQTLYYLNHEFSFCGVTMNGSPVFCVQNHGWWVVDANKAYNSYGVSTSAIETAYYKQILIEGESTPQWYGQLEVYEGDIIECYYRSAAGKNRHCIGRIKRNPPEPTRGKEGVWTIEILGDI